jgi:hypothetical protein
MSLDIDITGTLNVDPVVQAAPDYTINVKSGSYIASPNKKVTGLKPVKESSLSNVWDRIYGYISNPIIQFGRGTFTLDATLSIQGKNTAVLGMGRGATLLQASTNMNAHMFDWESQNYYFNVLFQNIALDGNKANQGGAGPYRGIACDITGACTSDSFFSYLLRLNDVSVKECKGRGLYFINTTGTENALRTSHTTFSANGGGGETIDVYVERMFDGYIGNMFCASAEYQKAITTSTFYNNYYAGGGEAQVCLIENSTAANPYHGNRHIMEFYDNPNNAGSATSGCLSVGGYAWGNYFNGKFGRNSDSSTANTASQLQMTDNATHNHFNCDWYHADAVTRTFKYAIEEKSSADYNTYDGRIRRLDRPNSGVAVYGTGYWSVASNSDPSGLRIL